MRHSERLRRMYLGGKGDRTARRYARFWSAVLRSRVSRRWVDLEVLGRISGRTTRFPLGLAFVDGAWYAVSMLGECNWTRNVRAAGGVVTIHGRGWGRQRLTEVAAPERPRILKVYLAQVPGARPHLPVDRHAPVEAFVRIAADTPVFRVEDMDPAASATG